MSEPKTPRFSVRPRTILIAMLIVMVVVAVAVWYSLSLIPEGRVELRDFSEESTATVGFAGAFPAEGDPALANPLGIVWDGERLFVAESDAGRISLFDSRGGALGTIGLPPAKGAQATYPSSLALVDEGRIAVVDNAGQRVIVVSAQPAERAKVLLELGSGADAPGQPTSVWYANGEYFVFDATILAVRVYDAEGTLDRTIAGALKPPVSFSTGLYVRDDAVYLVDSNGGRVLTIDPVTGEQRSIFADRYALPRAITSVGTGVAVVDTFERSVFLTTASGDRMDTISADTVPEGALLSPRGVVWLADEQRLYVTDAGAGRVVVFNVRLDPALQ